MFTAFGPFLRYLRRRARLTQRELSIAVGYSVAQICMLEKGHRLPDLTAVAALFIPALNLQDEPELAARLLHLAAATRGAGATAQRAPSVRQMQGAAPVAAVEPPASPRASPRLPAPLLPLIGRADEIAALHRLLLNHSVRLLTLIGPPGVGKTRLALQLAWDGDAAFADGARFIELAALHNPALVVTALAQALGIPDALSGTADAAALCAFLQDKQMLLVLDNFEQILPAAQLVADLLAAAPKLKILVTSRATLRIYGEHQYAVPPLALPDLTHLPSLDDLARIPAVALFLARARAIRPDVALTADNAPTIATICVSLDGLPLAIELAAARLKLFTLQELAAQLAGSDHHPSREPSDRVLPAHGVYQPDRRQQTLFEAIDRSYRLLSPEEQACFTRLGVLVGDWSLEAAAAVLHDDRSATGARPTRSRSAELRTDVWEGVAALVDKSLIQRRERDGETRFTMLETIRGYALARLVARGEEEETRHRHAQYYLELAETAAQHLDTGQASRWQHRLDQEQDNLRAALAWALRTEPLLRYPAPTTDGTPGRPPSSLYGRAADDERQAINDGPQGAIALRLANALGRYWYQRSRFKEGRTWLEAALALPNTPTGLRACALIHLGVLLRAIGAYPQAMERFEDGLAIFRAQQDQARLAWALDEMSHLALLQGDYLRATALATESLAIFRMLGDRRYIATALERLGTVALEQSDFERALPLLEECLQLTRALDNPGGIASVLNLLGMAELERGNIQRSLACFEESLAIVRHLNQPLTLAWTLRNLGWATLAAGAVGVAAAHFRESLALYYELGSIDGVAIPLEGLSGVAAAQGQPRRAARLLGAAAAIRDAVGMPLSSNAQAIYERLLAPVRAQLDPSAWEAELAHGRVMSIEQAVI
jgi:predicted ATPase/DNA-binding XRE family transcriptional regulator